MQIKWASWVSMFLVLSAFATSRTDTIDYKQILVTGMFAIMGVVTAFLFPNASMATGRLAQKAFQAYKGGAAGSDGTVPPPM